MDESPHIEKERPALSISELYKQGSECCRTYSELTMKVRTLAQQIVIGYAVGLGIFLSRTSWPSVLLEAVLLGAGVLLVLFAAGLWALNQHYSKAFEAIRDNSLVPLEELAQRSKKEAAVSSEPATQIPKQQAPLARTTEPGNAALVGPWKAHATIRRTHRLMTRLAWHLPYIILIVLGLLSVGASIFWRPGGLP